MRMLNPPHPGEFVMQASCDIARARRREDEVHVERYRPSSTPV